MGGVRRQILLTEKYQVLYKDTPPSRRWNRVLRTPTSHRLTDLGTGSQRTEVWKWKNSNFTVEKPDRHYFNQVFRVNISS